MKKLLTLIAVLCVAALTIAGCGGSSDKKEASKDSKTIKVGATAVPHAEILNFVKPELAKQGINLEVIEFADYIKPNLALADTKLDDNYLHHIHYLYTFDKDRN